MVDFGGLDPGIMAPHLPLFSDPPFPPSTSVLAKNKSTCGQTCPVGGADAWDQVICKVCKVVNI